MDPLITGLIAQGGPYAIIGVLLLVCIRLWTDAQKSRTDLVEALKSWKEDVRLQGERMAGLVEKTAIVVEALNKRGRG